MSTPLRRPWATALAIMALLVLTGGCGRAGGEDFQPTHNGAVRIPPGGMVGQPVNPAGDTVAAVGDVVLVEATWEGATSLALLANIPEDPGQRSGTRPVLVNDPYGDGTLVVDGQPEPGDLTFRVRGTAGPTAFLGQLAEVAASAGGRLLAEPLFAVLWLLALVGGTVLAVRGLRHRRPS